MTNLYFKVELEHDAAEKPERIAGEIRRQLLRFYGVREVEVSNIAFIEESGAEE